MAVVRKLQNNFTTGVLSPAVYARVDLSKYESGGKNIVNGVVHAHGGISKRPGTFYVDELPEIGFLLPFTYSVEQAYALCFMDEKMRVYKDGGVVLNPDTEEVVEIDTPYAYSELAKLKITQSADVMFLTHPNHPPMKLTRRDHHLWDFTETEFIPGIDNPTGLVATASGFTDSSDTYVETTTYYKVAAVNSADVESVPSESASASTLSTWPTKARVKLKWDAVPGAVRYEVYKNTRGYYEYLGSAEGTSFTDDNIEGDDSKGPKENRDPFNPPETPSGVTLSALDSGETDTSVISVRVSAVNSGGAESIASEAVTAFGPASNLRIVWTKSDASDVVSYTVYWKTADDESYRAAYVYDDDTSVTVTYAAGVNFSGTYLQVYEVAMSVFKEVAGSPVESEVSESKQVNAKFTSVWPSSAYLKLKWDTVEDATKYRIYFRLLSTTNPNPDAPSDFDWHYVDVTEVPETPVTTFNVTKTLFDASAEADPLSSATGFTPSSEEESYDKMNPMDSIESYPGAVGIYQQRMLFGRSNLSPQTMWTSETGSFDSMAVAYPLQDDNAITATADSRQVNEIRHFVPLRGGVLMLTSGAEFLVSAGKNRDAITPTAITFEPQSYWGSSDVSPIVAGTSVLMVQASGLSVRDLMYTLSSDGYSGNEVSLLAEHLFDSPIVSWAYQTSPWSTVWTCLESGKLLTFTYMKEQEIWAWSEHESSGGKFRSVTSIREDDGDQVYFVVERGGRWFVEYQKRRKYGDLLEDAFFLDCGLSYSGSGISHVTGLDHLSGNAVSVLADGVWVRGLIVAGDGSIDLPTAASKISIGRGYSMTVETLDQELRASDGPVIGERITVSRAVFQLRETLGLKAGPDAEHLVELKFPPAKNWGDTPALYSGTLAAVLPGVSREESSIVFVSEGPFPATVLSVMSEIRVG